MAILFEKRSWMRGVKVNLAVPLALCVSALILPNARSAITQWTAGESDFVSNAIQNSPYYHPVFIDNQGGSISYGPGGSGDWQFTITAASSVSSFPVSGLGNGGIGISPNAAASTLTITFTGNLPTAIGGNFFRTDATFPPNLVTGAIRATATAGASSSFIDVVSTAPGTFGFGGFTTDGTGFSSLTLSFVSGGTGNYATVGNFYVGAVNPVPEAGTWVAACFIGLVVLGQSVWGSLRRKLARQ